MSERKVLNKYFPPDFDPSKIVRVKGMGKKQQVVRLMAPFSMRCNTCGEYIYKGKKFNARKETAEGELYFGIKIFRFYIKCTQCSAEITFKTDPKNTDYVAEHGAMRNFEPWRDSGEIPETEEESLARLESEHAADDPMAELESKTVDSKREMDILDKLQEIRNKNARFERADKEHVLDSVSSRPAVQGVDEEYETREAEARRKLEQEEDEAEIRRVFSKIPSEGHGSILPSIELDEALEDDDGEDADTTITAPSEMTASTSSMPPPPVPKAAVIKRKLDEVEPDALSLLSEDAKRYASTSAPIVPKKKKKGMDSAMAAKLGIKIAPKDSKGKGKE